MTTFRRRLVLTLALFVLLFVSWKWSLVVSLLRPTLITEGIVPTPLEVPNPGLLYPRLGITTPVTESPATSPLEYHDWRELSSALRAGVSLAYSGAEFSSVPLAFITGHSSDVIQQPYATIFAGLGQAKVGDRFELHLSHVTYTYQVSETQEFDPRNTTAFEALAPARGQRVALVTCWPPLTTRDRFVVIGERVDMSKEAQ